jgi:hypothetical protein
MKRKYVECQHRVVNMDKYQVMELGVQRENAFALKRRLI